MARVLVSGLVNTETILGVDGFPVEYVPVRYPFNRVHTSVSGVGFNVARALATLGDDVFLASLVGADPAGALARQGVEAAGLSPLGVLPMLGETPASVILSAPDGRRAVHVDLKAVQHAAYPLDVAAAALEGVDLAVLTNLETSRPLLAMARGDGIPIATDLHALADPDDDYNQEFLRAADVVFLSDEAIPGAPEDFVRVLLERASPRVLVIGRGSRGALLALPEEDWMARLPAAEASMVRSTVGAGDALFSGFLHAFLETSDPRDALRSAVVFAAAKLARTGGGEGFLTGAELRERLAAGAAPDYVGATRIGIPG